MNDLEANIHIFHHGCRFRIKVLKNKIRCTITTKNYASTQIDYEHIMNIFHDVLYHNNMIKYFKLNDICQLKKSLQHYRTSSFIQCRLGSYMTNILRNNQYVFFDVLITDSRVKLDKYKTLVKDKLIYRCWLLKELCLVEYDNLIDIIHYYQLIY